MRLLKDIELYAINPDGTLKWTFKIRKKASSPLAIGDDGTIYIHLEPK